MRYTDLILKDFPISVYPLDETISGTSNVNCYSITDTSDAQVMKGEYIYNSGWKAENKGMPLVLGGEDGTYLLDNSNQPSLKIPRLNCFSANSIYTDSTLEFWLKISNSTDSEVKIMGIDDTGLSSFGLYAYKNYLIFKISEESFIAAPIQTWDTQHHIAIVYSYSGVTLICDGIKYYPYIKQSTQLEFQNNKNFVFYGNNDIDSVVIDAIALYKYGLSEQNCKRHMVYALGFNFSGVPFTRNFGTFASFENSSSKKVDDLIIPMNQNSISFENDNVILTNNGIQLSNTDKVFYTKNNNESQNFHFTNQSSVKIDSISNYAQDNFGMALTFRVASAPTDEEKTLFFVDGSQDTGDLQVVYLNGKLYLRIYSVDKSVSIPRYHEKEIASISINTDYLFAMSMLGNQYDVYINDTKTSYTDIPSVSFERDSSLYLGATALLSDTEELEDFFDNGYVYRLTIFSNYDEFNSVINSTAGNKTRFDSYYKNFTITFNNRIRLYRKGSIGLNISMDEFGRNIWDGTESRSSTAGIKIEHLYPKVSVPEVMITLEQFLSGNNTAEATQILSSQIEMIQSVAHDIDITDRWLSIDVDFDSDDCLYFPPILGQILFTSIASVLSSEALPDYDVTLEYSNFENSIKLQAQDSKPFLTESTISSLIFGENSGINISGLPLTYKYNFSSGSQDGQNINGIKTMSLFVKRNTSSTTKKIIEWEIVAGTTAPTSISLYIDGVSQSTINVSSRSYLLWSDLGVEEGVWKHITLVFNTPIIYKDSTKESPIVKFGDSAGGSNVSIQHLGVSEIEFTQDMILSVYKLFSGQNRVSASSTNAISVYETANGVQLYSNNWQRVV